MQRFTVVITEPAQEDIARSFAWGTKEWSREQAQAWVRELRAAINGLKQLPERHQLAPESDAFDIEIRQLVVGRYRILARPMRFQTWQAASVNKLSMSGCYSSVYK